MAVKQRGIQAEDLVAKGWKEDEECRRLALGHRHVTGGPKFMKDTAGKVHAVGGGRTRILDGGYRRWAIPMPVQGDDINKLEARQGTIRSVEYVEGRAV